jgi:polyhydroxyalkanoate synthesis regulator protein
MDPGAGYYRPVTEERKSDIIKFYGQAAQAMYKGFENRMANYEKNGDKRQKNIAGLFREAQKNIRVYIE